MFKQTYKEDVQELKKEASDTADKILDCTDAALEEFVVVGKQLWEETRDTRLKIAKGAITAGKLGLSFGRKLIEKAESKLNNSK